MPDKGDITAYSVRPARENLSVSMIHATRRVGEGRTLVLVSGLRPWYASASPPVLDRCELEDEHTRVLAQAVGDHLPYELALRAAELAAQLQRIR
jgi:hypothetical protein